MAAVDTSDSLTESRHQPEGQVLRGPRLALRPFSPDDLPFVYALSVHPLTGYRWRYRGVIPSIEAFSRQLISEVSTHLIVLDQEANRIGYVASYSADMRNRHAYVGLVMDSSVIGRSLGAEALDLFCDHLFDTFDYRKLYAEVPAFTLEPMRARLGQLGEGSTRFSIEAILAEHWFYAGEYWDMYIVSTKRKPST